MTEVKWVPITELPHRIRALYFVTVEEEFTGKRLVGVDMFAEEDVCEWKNVNERKTPGFKVIAWAEICVPEPFSGKNI